MNPVDKTQKSAKMARKAPPYVAFKTFRNFVDSLKVAMPGRIDRSVMHTLSGGTQSHLVHALRSMDLISAHDIPTDLFKKLVQSEGDERKKALLAALHNGYPFLFSDSVDLSSATGKQLIDLFNEVGLSGDTIRRSVAFFLSAAKDAQLSLSPYFDKIQSRSGGTVRKNSNNGSGNGGSAIEGGAPVKPPEAEPRKQQETIAPTTFEKPTWNELMASKFPSFDPAWADEVKLKWFDAFDKLMK